MFGFKCSNLGGWVGMYTSLGTSFHNAYTKILLLTARAYMHFDCSLVLMHPPDICTHWVSNYNSQAKCIHAWADNNRICIEEVPKLVGAFWICKPVIQVFIEPALKFMFSVGFLMGSTLIVDVHRGKFYFQFCVINLIFGMSVCPHVHVLVYLICPYDCTT